MPSIGPWRDPISGRWITPPPARPKAVVELERIDPDVTAARRARNDLVWQAVVASATASSIAD